MISDEIDYQIIGDDMQYVEIELDPQETVVGEAGSMMYMHDGIDFEARLGNGANPNQGFFDTILDVGRRVLTRESLFMTHYTNHSSQKSQVAFAAPHPGKIVPLDLSQEGSVICQKDAFLCAARGTQMSIAWAKRIGAGLFGGEGFILQRLDGDGMAFVHASGTICKKELRNESIRVDTGCIVAFSEGIDYDIQWNSGLKSMLFSGEGLFTARLSGTGTVWLQSLPFSRLADRVLEASKFYGRKNSQEETHYFSKVMDILKS